VYSASDKTAPHVEINWLRCLCDQKVRIRLQLKAVLFQCAIGRIHVRVQRKRLKSSFNRPKERERGRSSFVPGGGPVESILWTVSEDLERSRASTYRTWGSCTGRPGRRRSHHRSSCKDLLERLVLICHVTLWGRRGFTYPCW
jgi:hypothetical protein